MVIFYHEFISKLNAAELMKQKFSLKLNGSLAMENAGIERLQTRISKTFLPEAKLQMQHHLEKSKVHIQRLHQIMTNIGSQPFQGKLGLPLPRYPLSSIHPCISANESSAGNNLDGTNC
jgi:hypothetical protein